MDSFVPRLSRGVRFGVGLALALMATLVPAQDGGPARLRLDRSPDSPWPASAGTFEIWPSLPAATQFRVQTSDGRPVAAQVVWSATGEPALVQFDTSGGATRYLVRFETNASPMVGSWRPQAGVRLETRACRPGAVGTLAELARLIAASSPTYGRGFVPDIFLGFNPFGPTENYVALYSGWFTAPKPGDYEFATVSENASYLEVDGRLVAQWLGQHDTGGGRRGQHNGHLVMGAGLHQIQYVQVQFGGAAGAVAAWRPPGADRLEVMPSEAFPPVARFRAESFVPARSGQVYCEWITQDHCRLGESVAIRLRLRVANERDRRALEFKWRFDDGTADIGAIVTHFFALPGLRDVTVETWAGGQRLSAQTLSVRVEPKWLQRDDWRGDVFEEAKRDFLRRDLARAPRLDLQAMLALADRADDHELFTRTGEAFLQRADEFDTPASDATFYRLGASFEHDGDHGDALAEKAYRLALSPGRRQAAVADHAALRLAGLLIETGGDLDEAEKRLGNAPAPGLSAEERSLWRRWRGDLALARGQVEAARNFYGGATPAPSRSRFDASRAARLESASIAYENGRFEEAQQALDQLLTATPAESLSLDTGLLHVRLELKRKCFHRAFAGASTLARIAGGDPRKSEALYALAEAAQALGRTEDAQKAVRELLRSFPYSESAARAKDKWGLSR